MQDVPFNLLCTERDALRRFVLVHADSLFAFKEDEHPWFRQQEADDEPSSREVRHLTTTASCLESLADVPVYDVKDDDPPPPAPRIGEKVRQELEKISQGFAIAALNAKKKEWQSEGEARVYCRVRTLPAILQFATEETLVNLSASVEGHLSFVWERLRIGDMRAQGVAERPRETDAPDSPQAYPPNAFHTYWAIKLLHEYEEKGFLPELSPRFKERAAVAQLWARRTLAAQTALISGGQHSFDAHQLAWALSTEILCRSKDGDQPTTADLQHIELYDAALAAFFSEQEEEGRWRLYDPLFHYPFAGNAYCYTYETLAELLRLALRKDEGRVLRDRLRKYASSLIKAWHYARDTALELESDGLGWCSGHHPHSTHPEAWATASVFSYLQNLRCLVGYWTAEEATRSLSAQPSSNISAEAGRKILIDRGNTWHREKSHTVGRQLAMLFLHPIKAKEKKASAIDPDRPLVEEARSAVLFGPPGTSKTSLIEGLAAALGWNYVEIHASNFLSEGMDNVPKQADAIFQQLMELDRCVILFDEIDELIRLRDSDGTDPFGRFLTTSMLPKLAKLWAQRRVLFFVATNDIEAADPAIKRSQRFDAAIFVPPPSFEKKRDKLEELLKKPPPPDLTSDGVESALAEEADPKDAVLGVFALLRWDLIPDLARRMIEREDAQEPPEQALRSALAELGDALELTDWQQRGDSEKGVAGDEYPHRRVFESWRRQKLNERRDYRDVAVLRLDSSLFAKRPEDWLPYGSNEHYLQIGHEIEGALDLQEDGSVELVADGWKAVDKGTFSFEPTS